LAIAIAGLVGLAATRTSIAGCWLGFSLGGKPTERFHGVLPQKFWVTNLPVWLNSDA